MAEARAFNTERVVVREVTETEDMVELILTRAEAMTLFAVLYRVGGSPEDSHRKETESIVRSLERIYPEIKWNSLEYNKMTPLVDGHIVFKDNPRG